jgi:hypothetical protein
MTPLSTQPWLSVTPPLKDAAVLHGPAAPLMLM